MTQRRKTNQDQSQQRNLSAALFQPTMSLAVARRADAGVHRYRLILMLFLLCSIVLMSRPSYAIECEIKPSADFKPAEVVKTVINALRDNTASNEGIEQVYCMAAPSNKRITGPIERFTSMIKRGYGDMLNHVASEFDPITIEDSVARQRVWLETANGQIVGYLFLLGKQSGGEFNDMWMTEAVYRLDPSERQQSI